MPRLRKIRCESVKIRWTRLALSDFEQANDYIAQENPESARIIAQRILDATERMRDFPRIGRVGDDEDTREWLVPKTPYLVVYALKDDAVEILRLWHMARNRLPQQQ